MLLEAKCTCHDMAAYKEEDVKIPYWACPMDETPCEVSFVEVEE